MTSSRQSPTCVPSTGFCPVAGTLTLPRRLQVYDLRAGKDLGVLGKLHVTVQPYEPTIFAITPVAIPKLQLSAPERVARGGWLGIGVQFARPSMAATHAIHVDVVDPAGKTVGAYSGNWIANHGGTYRRIPLALNDAAGTWQVRARDVISGQKEQVTVEVY